MVNFFTKGEYILGAFKAIYSFMVENIEKKMKVKGQYSN